MSISYASPAARPPVQPRTGSLYRNWTEAPARVLEQLQHRAFSLADAAAMEAWAEEQRPWGLSMRLRRDLTGTARLAEIIGPDGCAPLALLYFDDCGRVRVDDYSGEVHACASLEEAHVLVLECL